MTGPRIRSLTSCLGLASAAVMLIVAMMHLALLPLGQWQDEFETFAWYRDQSVSALAIRFWIWSPRLVSELLIFVYAIACDRDRSPLFPEVLSLCWATFILPSIVVIIREIRTRADVPSVIVRANIAIALPIACLMSVELPDTFLWPMSAIAYLPGIATVFGMLFVLLYADADAPRSWLMMSALGVLGACCVEMAGIVAGVFFSSVLVWTGLRRTGPDDRTSLRFQAACCLPPIIAAAVTGLLILTHRARAGSPLTADALLVHRPIASIVSAVPLFLNSLVGEPASFYRLGPVSVTENFVCRLAWCAGTVMLGNLFVGPGRSTMSTLIKLLGLSIVIACFCSMAATLYQFGIMCCERQDTSRTCFEYVALACLGVSLSAQLSNSRVASTIGPFRPGIGIALILLAVIVPLPARLGKLAIVDGQSSTMQSATAATWRSGWRSGTRMTFTIAPREALVGKARDDRGVQARSHESDAQVAGILNYFRKDQVFFDRLQ